LGSWIEARSEGKHPGGKGRAKALNYEGWGNRGMEEPRDGETEGWGNGGHGGERRG